MADGYSDGTPSDTLESLKAERADLEKTVASVQQMARNFDTMTERRKSFDAERVAFHLQLKGPDMRLCVWKGILSPEGFRWHKDAMVKKRSLGEQVIKDTAAFCQALVQWAEDLERREKQLQQSARPPIPSTPFEKGGVEPMPDKAPAPTGANEPTPALNDAGIVLGAIAGTAADAVSDIGLFFVNLAGPEKYPYNPVDTALGYQDAFWKMLGFKERPIGARTPAENAQLGEAFESTIFALYGTALFRPTQPEVLSDLSEKPAWLQKLQAGIEFNRGRVPAYPYNEVYVQDANGGNPNRLDSYNPYTGEIVSRKFTQFSAIQLKTGINYVNEMTIKYAPGTKIANVPSNGNLAGQRLAGQMILEVPPQNAPIPQAVLDAANSKGVLIRDINGHIY